MIKLNKEKYLKIAKSQGAQVALTQLHNDMRDLEHDTFEGEKGWQPEMWQDLRAIRAFSRELWEVALNQGPNGQGKS